MIQFRDLVDPYGMRVDKLATLITTLHESSIPIQVIESLSKADIIVVGSNQTIDIEKTIIVDIPII